MQDNQQERESISQYPQRLYVGKFLENKNLRNDFKDLIRNVFKDLLEEYLRYSPIIDENL